MSVLVADVQSAFKRRYPFRTLSTNEFLGWLGDAVRYYSRWNPNIVNYEVTTVIDTARYALPSDCVMVRSVLYVSPTATGTLSMATLTSRGSVEPHNPSELVINQLNDDTGRRHAWEVWTQEGSYLVFEGGFAAAETLQVTYAALHALNALETAYETIPSEDLTLLANLVLAEVYEAEGGAHAVTPDYTEGIGQVRHHFVPANAAAQVRSLRSQLIDKYRGVAGLLA